MDEFILPSIKHFKLKSFCQEMSSDAGHDGKARMQAHSLAHHVRRSRADLVCGGVFVMDKLDIYSQNTLPRPEVRDG